MEKSMISVEEAFEILRLFPVRTCGKEQKELQEACYFPLSEDIHAPIDLPPFPQSAMDGYAIRFADLHQFSSFSIEGEIPAGTLYHASASPGTAVRIFTGAQVPAEYDTVVMQERTETKDTSLWVKDTNLVKGANIRLPGTQIKQGELALKKGCILSPSALAYLAGMGIEAVHVFQQPRIAVIVTGNELCTPGQPLEPGKIYESNSLMLEAVLKETGATAALFRVKDEEESTTRILEKCLNTYDMVLLSGGISVGKYDYVKPALRKCGVDTLFYKIRQKPGKPLYAGHKEGKPVFALPGNPAASLTCFYEYVYPILQRMRGANGLFPKRMHLPLSGGYTKKNGLAHFLKAKLEEKNVRLLDGQESFILRSFAESDCLVYIPEHITDVREGEDVEVHLLP